MFVCDSQKAREIDQRATEFYKIPSILLMEHAALEIKKKIEPLQTKKICIICGPGNNGGDGFALARLLHQDNKPIFVGFVGSAMSSLQQEQADILQALGIQIHNIQETLHYLDQCDLIVDCIFGSGLNREISGDFYTIIEAINQSPIPTISIDIPSGLDGSTGKIHGICVQANSTICLDCMKQGLLIHDGPSVSKEIICVDIGIPHQDGDGTKIVDTSLVQSIFPQRNNHGHKGSFGKALMIGGSLSMPGALSMAAKACYKSGIGTLTLMMPECIADLMLEKIDFAMRLVSKEKEGYFDSEVIQLIKENIESYDIISIGNGLGRNQVSKQMVEAILKANKPAILDADAFWAIQDQKELLNRNAPTLITPHIKEFASLLGKDSKEIAKDPFQAARDFAGQYPNVTLLLKSWYTLIVQDNQEYLYYQPNSALAKGGSGDILCGILVSCFGQIKNPLQAAICAVFLHGEIAETNKDPACAGPDDFLEKLNSIFKKYRIKEKMFLD